MIAYTLRHGVLKGILKSEEGWKRERDTPRLEYFLQIMKDMGCGAFKEVNELASDQVEWALVVASNQS